MEINTNAIAKIMESVCFTLTLMHLPSAIFSFNKVYELMKNISLCQCHSGMRRGSEIMIMVYTKGVLSGNAIRLMKNALNKAGGIHIKLPEQPSLPTIIFNSSQKYCHG